MSLLIKFLNNGEIGEAVNSPGCEPGMHRFDPGISPHSQKLTPICSKKVGVFLYIYIY